MDGLDGWLAEMDAFEGRRRNGDRLHLRSRVGNAIVSTAGSVS